MMNSKSTSFVRKISFYMANPKRSTNFIVPLLRQGKRRNYFKEKNYSDDWKSMSIYGGVGKCHKQNMDLAVHFHWELLSTSTQSYWFPSNERYFLWQYMYKYMCKKKHLIPNVIAARNQKNTYLIFGPLYLVMYYTGSVNWLEVFKNICWSQKKTPQNILQCCFWVFTVMAYLQISHGRLALWGVDQVRLR